MPREQLAASDPAKVLGRLLWALLALLTATVIALGGVAFYAAERFEQRDRAREQALAESAMRAEIGEIATQAKDLSWWDQAIKNLADRPDAAWADDNIGSYLTEAYEFSVALVIHANGKRGITFIDGIDRTDGALPELSPGLLASLHRLANEAPMDEPEAVTSFHAASEELYALSASALTYENPTEQKLEKRARATLILGRRLSGPFQVEVAEHYLLKGARAVLHFSQGADDPVLESVPITGLSDQIVGHVVWHHDPGAARFKTELGRTVLLAILALVVVGAVFGLYLWRTRRMATATNTALGEERRLLDARTHILTTIAHDLKTPLTAMQAAADLLLHFGHRMNDGEKRLELQMIQERIVLMDQVISEALAIGTDDEHVFAATLIDPAETIRQLWIRQLPAADRALELTDVRAARTDQKIDRTLFEQAVGNVLSNALKYGKDGSPVRARLSQDADGMSVAICNEGMGIPEGETGRISEAFYRASNVEEIAGVGLGLSIATRAAAQHGGILTVSSVEGEGATVTVTIEVSGALSTAAE
jgi:signal transduction histidine kinase